MRIIDMHCDTLLECYTKKEPLRKNALSVDLERMKNNGALVQFFAIFLMPSGWSDDEGEDCNDISSQTNDAYERFLRIYDFYEQELNKNDDIIGRVLTYDDILENERKHKMSSLLAIENGELLYDDIDRLDALYEKGVRLITLTWNGENSIGYPNSLDAKEHLRGLKPFGIEAVKRMNQLGIIIDVSHLSEGGFYDVAKYSTKPFVASHSCARALCNNQRNLTDDQLKCIAEHDGVVGVNFYAPFLKENSDYSKTDDILEHMKYMISVMGDDHVAIGSDFDGIDCGVEISDYGRFGQLVERMNKEFSEETVRKICYENAQRVLKACLK